MTVTCWDIDQHHCRDLIGPGVTVVDLGASTGAFALPAERAGATVLCVEPLPDNVATLEGLGLRVVDAAAAASTGWATLVEAHGEARPTGSYVVPDPDGSTPAVSLSMIVALSGGRIDVLKCDIEGGEYDLFAAAPPEALQAIGFLAIETHVWTSPDEPTRPGIGVRGGPRCRPDAGARLLEQLSATHDLSVDGPLDAGAVIYGPRR